MALPIKSTVQFLHGELERNWACHQDPYYLPRKQNINEMTKVSHRIVEGRMLEVARKHPEAVSKFLGRAVNPRSHLRLAGAGSLHTVLTDGQWVHKVHRRSFFMSKSEQEQLAGAFRHDHVLLKNYLGSMILPQTTKIIPSLLNTSRTAIVSTQKHIEYTDLGLFNGYTPVVNEEKLEEAKHNYPGIENALHGMAQAGLRMYSETGTYLLDTSGLHNIVVSEGELVSPDGLPLNTRKRSDIERITSQLQTLQMLTK